MMQDIIHSDGNQVPWELSLNNGFALNAESKETNREHKNWNWPFSRDIGASFFSACRLGLPQPILKTDQLLLCVFHQQLLTNSEERETGMEFLFE